MPDNDTTTLVSPGADGEAQIFQLNTSDMAALRREYAKDTRDFQLIPYGPSLTPSDNIDPLNELEGVVTPDMFDAVLNAAQFDIELNYPGTLGKVHGFSLYTPYRELERDTKVSAALQTRIMNSVEREWLVTPASEDAKDIAAADMIRRQLAAMETHTQELGETALLDSASGFDQVQAQFMDALLMGFAAGEVIWDKDPLMGGVFPREIKPKPQHRWAVYLSQRGWEPRLLTRGDRTLGVAIPSRKFLFYRHRPSHGPFGKGLGHELYFPLSYKRRTLELFLIHGQRYASPTVFLELPPNVGSDVAEAARTAASEVGSEAAITLGNGTKVIPFEGRVGNNSTYKTLVEYLDAQVAQTILGQTGTLDQSSDSGSRAQDEVADVQSLRLAKQDSDAFCAYIGRTLISWIVNENMPGARPPKISRPFPELEESENAKEMAERDKLVVEFTGRRLTREYVEERHGVELEDELIDGSAIAPSIDSSSSTNDTNLAEGGGDAEILPGKSQATNLVPHICPPVDLASTPIGEEVRWGELALNNLLPVLGDFQAAVGALVRVSNSPDDLDERFVNFLGTKIIREKMVRAIAPALSVARGIGQIDVEEELLDGEEGDRGVLFAEGLDPVLGFAAAIEAVGAAIPVPTQTWNELQGSDQSWAFTVAGIMQADVLNDIQAAVKKSVEGGSTFKDFKASFEDAYSRTGLSPLAPWRARLVLNQNVSNAYQSGRYERQEDPEYQKVAPYREYAHGFSDSPRPGHLALDGFVAKIDDPVWKDIFPPNGFNCSCRVFTLTQGQFDRGNYSLSDSLPSVNGSSAVRLANGAIVPVADEGFGQAPVAARDRKDALESAIARLPGGMVKKLKLKGELTKLKKAAIKAKTKKIPSKAKTTAAKKAPAKPKAKSKALEFPKNIDSELELVRQLGGSTGAELVKDKKTGQMFVRKRGANEGHLREEFAADELYRSMGVAVPRGKLYETASGPVKLTEYIEGQTLGELKGKDREKAIAQLQKNFVADALLGNWDVVGASQDNILVDGDGKVFRIDNGGSLRYRAQGELKGDNWNGVPLELFTLREQNPEFFGSLTIEDIARQARTLKNKQTKLRSVIKAQPETAEVLTKRLDNIFTVQKQAIDFGVKGKPTAEIDKLLKGAFEIRVAKFKAEQATSQKNSNLFGSNDHEVDFDAEKYAEFVGVSVEEAEERFMAISSFTANEYVEIRKSQRDGNDNKKAIAIEKYLATAQPYKGTVYRGMALNNEDILYKILNGKEAGAEFTELSMNSWSSEKDVSEGFAVHNDERPVSVMFQVENRSGASIMNISSYDTESEVLAPKNRRYRVISIDRKDAPLNLLRKQVKNGVEFSVILEELIE